MANYIYLQNDVLNGCGQARQLTEGVTNLEVEEALYNAFAENPEMYIWDGTEVVIDPDWEAKQAQKERERIQELLMTRSDFFDATIKAWRMRDKELLALIENLLETLPIDEVTKMVAINNFENAQNFYRKHDLFSIIVNVPIQLTETTQVIITNEHLDRFFDEVNKGNKATAWEHLPLPTLIEVEENSTTQDSGASADTTEYSYDDV